MSSLKGLVSFDQCNALAGKKGPEPDQTFYWELSKTLAIESDGKKVKLVCNSYQAVTYSFCFISDI